MANVQTTIQNRKSTINDQIKQLQSILDKIPNNGNWSNAGDLYNVQEQLADLLMSLQVYK